MTNRLKAFLVPALAFLVAGLALPAGAAASPDDVLRECADTGTVGDGYSRDDLRRARQQIEPDFASYSDCDDIIDSRLGPQAGAAGNDGGPGAANGSGGGSDGDGGAGGGAAGSGDGSGTGFDSVEEQQRRERARAQVEQELGDRGFDPNSGAAIKTSDSSSGLPVPVLLALIALALLLAAGAAVGVGKRNPAFMGALRRVPFPRRGR